MRDLETDIMKKVELFGSSSLLPKTLNSRVKRHDWLRDRQLESWSKRFSLS